MQSNSRFQRMWWRPPKSPTQQKIPTPFTPPNMDEPVPVANPLSLPSFKLNVSAENRFSPRCQIQQCSVEHSWTPATIFLTWCVITKSNRSCKGSGSDSDRGDVPLTHHQSAEVFPHWPGYSQGWVRGQSGMHWFAPIPPFLRLARRNIFRSGKIIGAYREGNAAQQVARLRNLARLDNFPQ